MISIENPDGICINCKFRPGFCVYGNQIPIMTEITKGRATRVSSQTTTEFSRKLPEIKRLLLIFMHKFYFYSITNFIM